MALFGPLTPVVDARPDGVTYVRAAEPLPPHADTWIDRLEHWAAQAPDRPFIAERDRQGGWRTLTYSGRARPDDADRLVAARAGRERRASAADPLRQLHRARPPVARRHGGRRADLPGLDRLFADLAGPEQAEGRHRADDAEPGLRRRRARLRPRAGAGEIARHRPDRRRRDGGGGRRDAVLRIAARRPSPPPRAPRARR